MGEIDNKKITLQGFIDQHINFAKNLRIFTGCVSKGPVEWILNRSPLNSQVSIIAGAIAPDLIKVLDGLFIDGHSKSKIIENTLNSNRLLLGLNLDVHMKVWLFNLENGKYPILTVWGSSNLTWQGLSNRKGEQNDWSFEDERFKMEELQWGRFKSGTNWISKENWPSLREKCWRTGYPKDLSLYKKEETSSYHFIDKKRPLTISKIQEVISEYFGINIKDLTGSNRRKHLTLARQIGMYLSRELTKLSYPAIGDKFGYKDHSTVMHSCNKIKEKIKTDPEVEEVVNNLKAVLINK